MTPAIKPVSNTPNNNTPSIISGFLDMMYPPNSSVISEMPTSIAKLRAALSASAVSFAKWQYAHVTPAIKPVSNTPNNGIPTSSIGKSTKRPPPIMSVAADIFINSLNSSAYNNALLMCFAAFLYTNVIPQINMARIPVNCSAAIGIPGISIKSPPITITAAEPLTII